MKQNKRLYSLLIPTSNEDDNIVEEAKKLLTIESFEEEIQYDVRNIIQPWMGKPWDRHTKHQVENAIGYYFKQLKTSCKIYDFTIMFDANEQEIVVHYKETPACDVLVLVVKII